MTSWSMATRAAAGCRSFQRVIQKPLNVRSRKTSAPVGTVTGCRAMPPYVTSVPPSASRRVSVSALGPPTALSARRGGDGAPSAGSVSRSECGEKSTAGVRTSCMPWCDARLLISCRSTFQ